MLAQLRTDIDASRAFKNEKTEFVAFAQKRFALSRSVTEEAYDYLVDALSQDGVVEDVILQRAIDDAKKSLAVSKLIEQKDIVDYTFIRAALAK